MRKFWLLFSQTVTVLLAAYFVVATLKPQWLDRRPSFTAVSVLEAPAERRGVARKTAVKKALAVKASDAKTPAKKVVAKKVVTKTPALKKTPVRKTVTNENVSAMVPVDGAANPPHTVDVAAILQAVPALHSGQPQALAAVAKALLDAKLRGKNLTATKVLKKFPQHFALLPPEKPRTVTYTPPQDLA